MIPWSGRPLTNENISIIHNLVYSDDHQIAIRGIDDELILNFYGVQQSTLTEDFDSALSDQFITKLLSDKQKEHRVKCFKNYLIGRK